jgi:hypothetical protein
VCSAKRESPHYAHFLLLGPDTSLSTIFLKTFNLCSSLDVTDQVSHPYKTTNNIIVVHISVFIFLDSRLEDKLCPQLLGTTCNYVAPVIKP